MHSYDNISPSLKSAFTQKKIDKLERQILDGKRTFVDDDGKPLYKVITKGNEDSESEVEVVFDETTNLMDSTTFKSHDMSEDLQVICDNFDITVEVVLNPLPPLHHNNLQKRQQLNGIDYTGKVGISQLIKCRSAVLQDKYLQIGDKTSLDALCAFCKGLWTYIDRSIFEGLVIPKSKKLYAFHEEKHGFPGMLGSIDFMDWPYAQCLTAYRAQFCK
ncbi:homeobox protein knotted-1-like protein 2 [Tanacetum coccineum]